ncbi:MAG: Dabb family protein [Actinomycetota bacterium]
MLRHVVLFQWKPETPPETIRQIEETFAALPAKIPQIKGFEWGRDVSVQGFDRGYTHCFVVTLESEADRDAYLPHPDHAAFIALSRPNVDTLLVMDYLPTDVAGARN